MWERDVSRKGKRTVVGGGAPTVACYFLELFRRKTIEEGKDVTDRLIVRVGNVARFGSFWEEKGFG